MMYQINTVVLYGTHGLYRIAAIEKRSFYGESREYFILRQLQSENNIIYVPTDNEAACSKMRPVCSKAEVDDLIAHMKEAAPLWVENEKDRQEAYYQIIRDGNRQELIRLIKTLYLRQKDLASKKKKLRSFDENNMKFAEDMLFEEFAFALGIERDEVVNYIEAHIG